MITLLTVYLNPKVKVLMFLSFCRIKRGVTQW